MAKNPIQTIQEEAGLDASWKPIDSAPVNPSDPSSWKSPGTAPLPNAMANNFAGVLNPSGQHDVFFVRTQVGSPSIAKLPLLPLAASGQPTVGSAVQSGSTVTIVDTASSVAAGPAGAIQFNNSGPLGGSGAFTWNSVGSILTISGGVVVTGSVTITGSIIISGTVGANIFNATTGFEIGGTATAGQYLRGNGTNFVSAVLSGTDIAAGIVGVTFGGTGSNLSATGGAHEVVQQSTVGGDFTVGQLSFSDISGAITPSQIISGSVNLTAQTANHAAATLFSVGASGAGSYLITVYAVVSQAATVSSTLPDSRIIFTDQDSGAVITTPVTGGLIGNATSTFSESTFIANAKASTVIQYDIGQISPYASSGATPMQFAYHARAVYIG